MPGICPCRLMRDVHKHLQVAQTVAAGLALVQVLMHAVQLEGLNAPTPQHLLL